MKNKLLLRILLSPVIFIWGLFFTAAMMLFPFSLITMMSFVLLVAHPFSWMIKRCGVDMEYQTTFFSDNVLLDRILGTTICIWFPFATVFYFVTKGILITSEKTSSKDFVFKRS